jgi:hypothetical protein
MWETAILYPIHVRSRVSFSAEVSGAVAGCGIGASTAS